MNLDKFNPAQRQAIEMLDAPLLVIAAAGSGKTGVITAKISYLIKVKEVAPERICAVTFTNKAAQEMRDRLKNQLQAKQVGKIKLGTFHALGFDFIKKEAKTLGYRNGISIFDPEDTQAFLKDFLKDDADAAKTAAILISNWKNQLLTPDEAKKIVTPAEEVFVYVYEKYQQQLKACNSVDLDDLIYLPVKALEADKNILDAWQHRFDYLLVDEYQDTNLSQYEFIRLLTGASHSFTVVGDDYQSIYSFRGARPKNLEQLTQDFSDLKVIKLEQNYRSTNRILKAANALIANNQNMFEKKLWSQKGDGDKIKIITAANEEAEADKLANDILVQKLNLNLKWSDFAVLYRSNHHSRLLEIKLQESNIPYKLTGGTSFYDRVEIKDLVAYLRLLNNPDDNVAFFRIVNTPRRSIGATTLERLSAYAQKRGASLYSVAREFGLKQELSESAFEHLQKFIDYMDDLRQRLFTAEAPVPILREMLQDINYVAWLEKNSTNSTVAERRFGNLELFLKSLDKVFTNLEEENPEGDNLEAAIAKLIMRAWLEKQAEEEEDDQVFLSTLHAAKGLEFTNVYIMGFEEGVLPHKNSMNEEGIEEERRLAYVGITRAMSNLTLSLAKKRRTFEGINETSASRFLKEIPTDLILQPDKNLSSEEKYELAQNKITMLKNMLMQNSQ